MKVIKTQPSFPSLDAIFSALIGNEGASVNEVRDAIKDAVEIYDDCASRIDMDNYLYFYLDDGRIIRQHGFNLPQEMSTALMDAMNLHDVKIFGAPLEQIDINKVPLIISDSDTAPMYLDGMVFTGKKRDEVFAHLLKQHGIKDEKYEPKIK
jgi:hypothetical protein